MAQALPGAARGQSHTRGRYKFGVQLNAFPIDPNNFSTFLSTLAVVKQIGYDGFESSFRNVQGQFDSPQKARREIEATGLTFFGVHIFLNTPMYDPQTTIAPVSLYERVGRGSAPLGAHHLILSGAPAASEEQLHRKVEALNRAGAFAKSVGMGVAYHNHWPEFESKINEIEVLYTKTDPALVGFLLDAGHAYHGGANVPEFIRRHYQRIVGFHLRDYRNGKLVTLGTGTFPLAAVAAAIESTGWSGWIENEEERDNHSQDGASVIRPAYRAMKEAFAS